MQTRFPVFDAIRQEFYDWRRWTGRAVVLALTALAQLQLQRLPLRDDQKKSPEGL